MDNHFEELNIPTLGSIKKLLDPIYSRLDIIQENINKEITKPNKGKFYRNNDLKNLFGLSSNTIIKYRDTGVLPYTRLGDIYLYEIVVIDKILINNAISL
ncbi:DNA-binding protein [Flavobacterium qiangtangense]|uniref:DNA-binding protein n=1 Tax=Flavobacterium qiangtangense TaxID=1442595 RepID=A0ABW1PKA2_9FLAO